MSNFWQSKSPQPIDTKSCIVAQLRHWNLGQLKMLVFGRAVACWRVMCDWQLLYDSCHFPLVLRRAPIKLDVAVKCAKADSAMSFGSLADKKFYESKSLEKRLGSNEKLDGFLKSTIKLLTRWISVGSPPDSPPCKQNLNRPMNSPLEFYCLRLVNSEAMGILYIYKFVGFSPFS